MIYKLRNRFIRISALSLITVLVIIYLAIFFANTAQLDSTMDSLTSMVSNDFKDLTGNDQAPPDVGLTPASSIPPKEPTDNKGRRFNFFNQETRFSTRFFFVKYDSDGSVLETNTDKIATVSTDEAVAMATNVLSSRAETGWSSNFRYRVVQTSGGTAVYFVDGSMNREMSASFLITVALVLAGSGACVLILIIFFSARAVRPVAESYAKQKQFVTDANHELKTPLTLILANLDIAEAELGKNEWLDDIRYEGEQMNSLVAQLVSLSRMDEDEQPLNKVRFNISEMLLDITSEFKRGVENAGKTLICNIKPDIEYEGEEESLRRLVSILMDNALKYCDNSGIICCNLTTGRHIELTVTNSFSEVDNTELDRLFDRFYRSNKARTSGTGFGIGLSIAYSIVEKHGGSLKAYKAAEGVIGFKAIL